MIKISKDYIIPTIFPDKTSQVWKIDTSILNDKSNVIKWDFEHESEFLYLAQIKMLIKELKPEADIILQVPYFPYARQDHKISNQSTFALRSFCLLLKSLNFTSIFTYDLHSNIAFEYLDNLTNVYPNQAIKDAISKFKPDVIVFPDKGAQMRYAHRFTLPHISIHKERDQLTGYLTIKGIINNDNIILSGKKCLIVDDLCDGGGTFILAAQELFNADVKEVGLYTTHGIYSKGVQILKDNLISRVFNLNGEV
jgi:ribose-phosphate pyrophosphokinase